MFLAVLCRPESEQARITMRSSDFETPLILLQATVILLGLGVLKRGEERRGAKLWATKGFLSRSWKLAAEMRRLIGMVSSV